MHIDCLSGDTGASVGYAEQTGGDAMRGTFWSVELALRFLVSGVGKACGKNTEPCI